MADLIAFVTIQGTRPLLWHHCGPDAIPLQAREKSGKAGNDPSEWKKTVLVTAKGQLYLEPSYIFGAIRDGAKHTPRKRGTLQPMIAATLEVLDERILTNRWMPKAVEPFSRAGTQPVYVDVRSVRNPGTRAMNIRYRIAAAAGWTASFRIRWDNTIIGEDAMESVLRDAGKFVGVGSGRTLGLGRFQVVEFKASPGEQTHAKEPSTKRSMGKNTAERLAKRRS